MPFSRRTIALLLAPAACWLALPGAMGEPLTTEQLEKILQELDNIQQVVEGKRLSTRSSAVEMFRNAAASDKSALEFYMNCVKALRFDERDARASEFRDWRDQNEAKLKEKSALAALRLQLQYLVLTLRAAEGVDRRVLIPELEAFAAGIVTNAQNLEDSGLKTLREPVNNTVFAEAYELNQSLQLKDWSFTPGDTGSVYEKAVLPYYREHDSAGLSSAWDRRIELERQFVEATDGDAVALKKFQEERTPRLQWQKAEDVFRHASQQEAALAMIQLLRANPDHPDATKWVQLFRALLTEPAEEAPSAGS